MNFSQKCSNFANRKPTHKKYLLVRQGGEAVEFEWDGRANRRKIYNFASEIENRQYEIRKRDI